MSLYVEFIISVGFVRLMRAAHFALLQDKSILWDSDVKLRFSKIHVRKSTFS